MQNSSGDYKIQFYAEGLSEDFTAGADYTSGDPIAVAGRAGIVQNDVASGKKGSARVSGLAVGRKITGAMTAGAVIGWDNDGDPLNGTAGTGALTTVLGDMDIVMGSVAVAALETDETVVIRLNAFANADTLDAVPVQAHIADVAAQTQDDLTDNSGGTPDTTLAAVDVEITDPADTPADADALRDDLVANAIPEIEASLTTLANAVASLTAQLAKVKVDVAAGNAKTNAVLVALETAKIVADS